MEELLRQLLISKAAPMALTAAERWAAAKPTSGLGDYGLLYALVLGLLAAVAATIVALLLRRWIVEKRRLQRSFMEHCEKAGLSEEETNLLTFAAKLGKLRAPVNIVVTEAVFHRCMHLLIACPRVSQMSTSDKGRILGVVNSALLKLGFDDSMSLASERRISDGAIVTLTGSGVVEPVQATVLSSQGWEIRAQTVNMNVDIPTGVNLRGRFHRSGAIWEFETSLVFAEGRNLTLSHPQNTRFINRRRFRRARVNRPASIAYYPFMTPSALKQPWFLDATLVELGATGLVIEVNDLPSLPEKARMLVEITSAAGRGLNAVGILLRRETITSRKSKIVVELTDLSESDISELVAETNLAVQNGAETSADAPARTAQPAWRE